ncbi:simple sugar transport system permease protein [Alkalispirochaeta americana]|uniref:Simple sugar transport system permease protein n=1 Tax=Alkalispirochaeta americana TaxID=159291 RepID=A0A1N6WVH7_9SPIO|nr:ABC transporter permease [Alkalispirochaeta americana]SIQ94114.1 simple sugar transport system permease protein [Alkalispirochaeta americana]
MASKFQIGSTIKTFVTNHMVILVFSFLCIGGFYLSNLSLPFFVNDLISRIARNMFIVLALIIPVVAGMGLNFAVVLGAMGAQFALIMATHWGFAGFGGVMGAMVLSLPMNVLFGYLTGKLFNRSKGKEMISGLILGFFALGIYQLILLVFIGTIIPMDNPDMVLSSGVGLRVSIDVMGLKYGLDHLWQMKLSHFTVLCAAGVIALNLFRYLRRERLQKHLVVSGIAALFFLWGLTEVLSPTMTGNQRIPMVTFGMIGLLCLFTAFVLRTKLGQDFKAVGQDQHIALVSGIKVDQVRLIAIILSTVFAGFGQIMFIQNMGVFSTYGAHEQTGLFAVASILIGGATVVKANIGHAVLGTILFHSLFIISPLAAQTLFGNAQVGEYFRVFLAYGVIGAALAMYAWKKLMAERAAFEAADSAS